MMRRLAGALVALLLLLPAGLAAGQKDMRLGPLFERLKGVSSPGEAQVVEMLIWQIWTEAGDPATDSLMQLGLAAMQNGDLPGALSLFDAVTSRAPEFAEGWNKRATVFYMMGAYDRSAEDVARVLALEPRHFGALSGLGLINLQREREDAAIAAFEQALKVNPHMPGVRENLEQLRKKRSKSEI